MIRSRSVITHTCGHMVVWMLDLGLPRRAMVTHMRQHPCPACGGEEPAGPRFPVPVVVRFAGIGAAYVECDPNEVRPA